MLDVNSPDTVITIDHIQIKEWTDKHHGVPAVFDDPESGADKSGVRIDFPGKEDEKYMNEAVKTTIVDWDIFFSIFEDLKLAFMYDKNFSGEDYSNAYMFIKRDQLVSRR